MRNWVCDLLEGASFGEDAVGDVRLALSEAFTNIIVHALDDVDLCEEGRIEVAVEVVDDAALITLRDYGQCFSLSDYIPPDLEEFDDGGYGIYLIHRLMDEVAYVPQKPGTELKMWKYRSDGAAS